MLMSDWSSDVCSSDLEGEKFVGFVEQLLDYAADGSFPILLFDHRCQGRIGARHVLELLEQFAIDPHPFGANLLLLLTRDRQEERRAGKECVSPCRSRWSP